MSWSGWQDLNLRPPASKAGRLAWLTLHPDKIGAASWNRTTFQGSSDPCYDHIS
jgi:hypothetical protein